MVSESNLVYITLDPPYRVPDNKIDFTFIGWSEVDDDQNPELKMTINGLDVHVANRPAPRVRDYFTNIQASGLLSKINFKTLFRDAPPLAMPEPFLLVVEVTSGSRARAFEYAVTADWCSRIFGRVMRVRKIPPEHLQVRITGAAAGAYHSTGRTTAEQIARVLDDAGRPLLEHRRILDFGCGPGRVLDCIHDMHPTAELFGCDIDGEAVSWAADALGDIASFEANDMEPPLPFADDSFDLIYGISVFTHLPEDLQLAWLSELRRVLKPGGLLLTTKLNPEAYEYVPEPIKQRASQTGFVYWGEAPETEGLPDIYRLAYHTDAYVRRVWEQYFEVLHVGSHDMNQTQDAVLLRRPRHALSWLPPRLRRRLHGIRSLIAGRLRTH